MFPLRKNFNIKIISERAGHSNVMATLNPCAPLTRLPKVTVPNTRDTLTKRSTYDIMLKLINILLAKGKIDTVKKTLKLTN